MHIDKPLIVYNNWYRYSFLINRDVDPQATYTANYEVNLSNRFMASAVMLFIRKNSLTHTASGVADFVYNS
jgi:hypothetical protein